MRKHTEEEEEEEEEPENLRHFILNQKASVWTLLIHNNNPDVSHESQSGAGLCDLTSLKVCAVCSVCLGFILVLKTVPVLTRMVKESDSLVLACGTYFTHHSLFTLLFKPSVFTVLIRWSRPSSLH